MSVWRGEGVSPQVNKFEEVFSNDHQMSVGVGRSHIWYPWGGVCTQVKCGGVGTMRSNAPWDPPVDRQTPVKTLPSHNFVCVR